MFKVDNLIQCIHVWIVYILVLFKFEEVSFLKELSHGILSYFRHIQNYL